MMERKKHVQSFCHLHQICKHLHRTSEKQRGRTFVEVQLLVLLVLLLLLLAVLLFVRVVVVVVGDPLDLPARLLPLPTLVQRRLWRFFDEVISLRLGQDGSSLTLEEELQRRNRSADTTPASVFKLIWLLNSFEDAMLNVTEPILLLQY